MASRWMRTVRGIATIYGIAFAFATAGFGIAVYLVTEVQIEDRLDARLADETRALLAPKGAAIKVDQLARRIAFRQQGRATTDIGYQLTDRQGRTIAGRMVMAMPPPGFADVTFNDALEGLDEGRALVSRLVDGGMLAVVADREPIEDFDALLTRIFLAAFGAAIVGGTIGGVALAATIRRRLTAMNGAAEAIIAGNLSQRMPLDGSGSEFDRQAATLNRMLDRIAELMANLRQVSGDIAHDLRSPLTRLRNRIERLRLASGDAGEVTAQADAAMGEIDGLLAMFGALLRIAEIEAGARRARFAPLDLTALVADVVETFGPAIEDAGRLLRFPTSGGVKATGDTELLTLMVVNLIENAARHTPPGTTITASVGRDSGACATIVVADDGPGIGDTRPDTLLQRFVRLDASRTTEGHGLGLAVANAIARLHDGTLVLADTAPGLRVVVTLPQMSTLSGCRGVVDEFAVTAGPVPRSNPCHRAADTVNDGF